MDNRNLKRSYGVRDLLYFCRNFVLTFIISLFLTRTIFYRATEIENLPWQSMFLSMMSDLQIKCFSLLNKMKTRACMLVFLVLTL